MSAVYDHPERCRGVDVVGPTGEREADELARSFWTRADETTSQPARQATNAPESSPTLHAAIATESSPLAAPVADIVRRRTGVDFSHVRVHTSAATEPIAEAMGARNFAVGSHVFLPLQPHAAASPTPQLLHELGHVAHGASATHRGRIGRQEKRSGGSVTDFSTFPLSPDVAKSWGVPPQQQKPAETADSNAHTSQMTAKKPSFDLPRAVRTISVLHWGTFGQNYVIAELDEPSIQTAPDPQAGVNFDTYIVTETRAIPAQHLGGTLYRVFMGSAECPGCHFGKGLEVDINGENPIIATLPIVLSTVVPAPEGGPPPKQGISVRQIATGPLRPYDPTTVPPARQLPQAAGKQPTAPPAGAAGPLVRQAPPAATQATPMFPQPAAAAAGKSAGTTPQLPAGPGASLVQFDKDTVDALVKMWRDEIVKHPERTADFERYIQNDLQKRNLLQYNLIGGLSRLGEQSEREMQFLLQSKQKYLGTSQGKTVPDFTQGTDWAGEIKNWNVLYPTESEMEAAAQGQLPKKLQGLVDQVAKRREKFGNRQTVVLDLRGQLSLQGVTPEVASHNRWLIHQVGLTIASTTGLPIEQIQILVW
jgi:hypothetical protein